MTNLYAPPRAAVRDIETPAQVVHAERGARLGAAIVDSIIFMAMVYVPLIIAALGADAEGGELMIAVGVGLTLIGFAVWCWLTLRFMALNGQSIAKKLFGIKVVRADGTPVRLGRLVWLRNVLQWIMGIVPFYAFIDALFIFGEAKQCLHDKMADTIVVKA